MECILHEFPVLGDDEDTNVKEVYDSNLSSIEQTAILGLV
jgi:hypothetical protein